MRKRVVLGGLLAALVFLAGAAPAAALPRDFYGIVPQTDPTDAEFARMGQGGVGSYRWPLSWRQVEQTEGTYDWTATDALITQLSNNAIEPRPFVCCVPAFLQPEDDVKVPPTGAEQDAGWQDFLRAVAQRYGPNGTFWADNPSVPFNPLTDYQIGNEPNSSSFNHPKPSPSLYAHLLEISNQALRQVDPNAYIVVGGMYGTPKPKEPPAIGIPAWKFLQKIYKRGAKNDFDAVAPHPYGRNLKHIKKQITKHRQVLKKNRDKRKDIVVTEMGWSSDNDIKSFLGRGRKGQAKILKKSFKLLKKNRKKWNVRGVMWFTIKDHLDPTFCDWCDTAGLFDQNFVPKPAWRQYVKFTGGIP